MKKTPLKRKKSISLLKKKLWELTKQIIRQKYVVDGCVNCYTCDKLITNTYDMHTAHFIPSASCGAFLRYDFRNLRICCMTCNVWLGGNGAEYYRRMVKEIGKTKVEKMFKDKQITIKADQQWYENKIKEYELERNKK